MDQMLQKIRSFYPAAQPPSETLAVTPKSSTQNSQNPSSALNPVAQNPSPSFFPSAQHPSVPSSLPSQNPSPFSTEPSGINPTVPMSSISAGQSPGLLSSYKSPLPTLAIGHFTSRATANIHPATPSWNDPSQPLYAPSSQLPYPYHAEPAIHTEPGLSRGLLEFEVGELSTQSNAAGVSLDSTQHEMAMLRKRIADLEAHPGLPATMLLYSANPVTSLSPLQPAVSYGSSSGNHSTGIFPGEKLNNHNYFSWAQTVKMLLQGRHKFGFLTGSIPRPRPGTPQEDLWIGEDSLLRSMLITSMEPSIGKPLLYAETAKDIWDHAQRLYSNRQNASRLYTLKKQEFNCKQGTLDVTTFFNKLSLIWQEMDLCRELAWKHPDDAIQYSRLVEADRVYIFLAGLHSKFDMVCGRILGQKPIPPLMDVYSKIRLEEARSTAMTGVPVPSLEAAAFSARPENDKQGKPIPVCEHCKR